MSPSHPREGGEIEKPTRGSSSNEEEIPKVNEPKGNETLGSKGKEKIMEGDDEEEEETEAEKLKCKTHDEVLNENARIEREA